MLNYHQLKERPRELLTATGLTPTEFEQLLAAFESASTKEYPAERTLQGKPRQGQPGAGAKGKLKSMADKLLQALVRAGVSKDQSTADDARPAIRVEPRPGELWDSPSSARVATSVARVGSGSGAPRRCGGPQCFSP